MTVSMQKLRIEGKFEDLKDFNKNKILKQQDKQDVFTYKSCAAVILSVCLKYQLLCYCLPLCYLTSIIFIPILHLSSAIFVFVIKSRFHANFSCMLT